MKGRFRLNGSKWNFRPDYGDGNDVRTWFSDVIWEGLKSKGRQ
jgi:hypothetical protein